MSDNERIHDGAESGTLILTSKGDSFSEIRNSHNSRESNNGNSSQKKVPESPKVKLLFLPLFLVELSPTGSTSGSASSLPLAS